MTSIGNYAFRGCSSLTAINIPESVTSIGKSAFYGCSSLTAITIPESVTSIGESAFGGCSSLERVTINCANVGSWFSKPSSLKEIVLDEGVTSIGDEAFSYCSSLTAITLPKGVTSIGKSAFSGCESLTAINIPEDSKLTSIGKSAFDGCESLTAVHISSLEVWCNIDFANYSANPLYSAKNLYLNGSLVTELTIPNSVTAIKNYAFWGCSSLKGITIPESVTSIGGGVFRGCSSLTAITLPEGVTNIGTSAFLGCSSLTDINIPESVTSIGDHAFRDCSSLTSITIPEGVTSIGDEVFYGCSSLTAITIPEGVTSIGESAFSYCSSLKTVINYSDLPLQRGSNDYGKVAYYADRVINADEVIDGYVFKTIEGVHYLTGYIGDKTELTLPADYKGENYQIGERAFYKCSSLAAITIPEDSKLTSIGESAFLYCSSLTAVHISSLEVWCNIDFASSSANPLSSAKNLYLNGSLVTELTIPNSVTAIKNYAFSYYSSLTTITIPESVTSIGEDAFSYCSSLERVTINCANVGRWFSGLSSLKEVVLGESVTSIGDYAFSSCSSLTAVHISSLEVWCNIDFANYSANPLYYAKNLYLNGDLVTELTIPNSVTAIKNYAFSYYSSLTAITIPEGVTSIGDYAFSWCSSLTAITIPESVTSIGDEAFYRCSSLTAITIPESVTSIGERAFRDCSSLTAITIPESVTSIGNYAFSWCSGLTSITLSEGVTSIGDYAFSWCSSLTAITIPEGVTSIGERAFRDCSSLTTVVLPKSVKDIYSNAFANCPELTDVYCYAETVPTTNTNAFNGSDIEHATLHVPASAINSYRSAAPWSGFGTIIALGASITEITLSESSATLTEGEDLTLTMTTNPENADRNLISWSSSNPSVASVDRGGKVTAIAPGTATITATANDGSGVSAQCEVTVTPASYVITFLVDGEVILTDTLTRGSTINLPDVPEKEGYTFSGWSEVPETMPANDVTYSAYYIANVYKVYYFAEDKLVNMVEVTYGEPIPEYIYEPTTEGDEFLGWIGETYATMPAHDVTYTANISSDINAVSTDKGQQKIVIYDLHGRRVTNPIKGGIYIINGRKVMIK